MIQMQNDLQRFLDEEIERDDLSPESQREAERFEQWTRAVAGVQRERAPAWLENRIMVSLPPRPNAPLSIRLVAWLLEPRRVRIRPLPLGLAGAAVLALALVLPREGTVIPGAISTGNGAIMPVSSGTQVYVQFVLTAPQANSVAVAGDFNNWEPGGFALRDPDGDGIWSGFVPLRPGPHKYMFIVDGEQWVTDPGAERYDDDGFGMRNAVITVAPPPARTL